MGHRRSEMSLTAPPCPPAGKQAAVPRRPLRSFGWQSGMLRPPPPHLQHRGALMALEGYETPSIGLLCQPGPAVLQDELLQLTLPDIGLSHPQRDASLWLCIFISTYVHCSCVDGS